MNLDRGCCDECGEGFDNEEEWIYNTHCAVCGEPIPKHLIIYKDPIENLSNDKFVEVFNFPRIVSYSKDMKYSLDINPNLKFIGNSRINDDLIYEITTIGCKIPNGFRSIITLQEYGIF